MGEGEQRWRSAVWEFNLTLSVMYRTTITHLVKTDRSANQLSDRLQGSGNLQGHVPESL